MSLESLHNGAGLQCLSEKIKATSLPLGLPRTDRSPSIPSAEGPSPGTPPSSALSGVQHGERHSLPSPWSEPEQFPHWLCGGVLGWFGGKADALSRALLCSAMCKSYQCDMCMYRYSFLNRQSLHYRCLQSLEELPHNIFFKLKFGQLDI